ncbi:MAG: hypothetical protein IH851_06845 [Armatimonadetes bacterium]|nr:hypothetical protein [Armatimonadota bacterium]
MRPLLYLTVRSVVNSFRRAVRSPVRLIGVVMLVGWWFMMMAGNLVPQRRRPASGLPSFDLPEEEVIFAILFLAFLVIFLLRALTLFRVPGMYRHADSDVLFATPLSPKLVMAHRFVLDYLITLFLPLLILVFGGRRTVEAFEMLFRSLPDPSAAGWVGRTFLLSFLLVSLFGVALSYAAGLYLNRDADASRRARKVVGVALAAGGLALAATVASAILSDDTWRNLAAIPNSQIVQSLLLPVASAARLAIAPLYASWAPAAVSGVFLVGGSAGLLWLALRQSDHLYDMAARGTAASQVRREAQRRGDPTLLLVQAAQSGKLKPRRLRGVYDLRLTGPWGILWKEAILGYRMSLWLMVLMSLMAAFVSAIPVLEGEHEAGLAAGLLPIQILLIVAFAIGTSQNGFQETLRRVDTQKPLPFSPTTTCAMEVAGKALGPILVALVAAAAAFAFRPAAWDYALALAIGLPSAAILTVAVQLPVMLVFPDLSDPTQRAFRGLVQFLGTFLALTPSVLAAIVLAALGVPLPLTALVACLINLGGTAALVGMAGPVYASFNPSE